MRKEVKVARNAPIVAAAGVAKRGELGKLEIWNWDNGEYLTEFATVYDGCGRSAVDSSGERLIAANWRKGKKAGIACYDITSGEPIWHRTDIGHVQHMHFSPREDRVWCNVEGRPVHCLDAGNGSTLTTVKAAEDAFDSPYSPHTLFLRHKVMALEIPERLITMPRFGWNLAGVAFSRDTVCVAETTKWSDKPDVNVGYIRCFEVESGTERWQYRCPDAYFMQQISYQDDGFVYCVQSGCETEGWVVTLLRLTLESGSCTELCRLGPTPPYFGGFGNGILVTPEGEVISLNTGGILRRLPFKGDQAVTAE